MAPLPFATRYNDSWLRRPCWEFDEAESSCMESSADEDDYAWYFAHPERYIWRPRRMRKPPSLKMGAELLDQGWNSRPPTPTLDARSSTSSSQSSNLSSLSSEISEAPCLGSGVEEAHDWQVGSYSKAATRTHDLSPSLVDPCLAGGSTSQNKLSAEYGQQDCGFLSTVKQWRRIPFPQLQISSL